MNTTLQIRTLQIMIDKLINLYNVDRNVGLSLMKQSIELAKKQMEIGEVKKNKNIHLNETDDYLFKETNHSFFVDWENEKGHNMKTFNTESEAKKFKEELENGN